MQLFRVVVFLGLLAAPPVSAAQKTIRISDSLAANADRLVVKKGAQWIGQIARWRVGAYAVVSSKGGWTDTRTRANLFRTEIESTSTEKFSFVLTDKGADSAFVNAARNTRVNALQSLQLGNGWSLGSDEVVSESDNFAAFVTLNRDTTETWALFEGVTGSPDYTGFLTNGERRISLAVASSNKDPFDVRGLPALGLEFVENGHSLGAVQYFGGPFGMTHVVWIRRDLDAKTKLLLAATMTALLQVKSLR